MWQLFLVFTLIGVFVDAQTSTCSGQINTLPVFTGEPVWNATTKNGALYWTGSVEPRIAVIHMWGTPYEMGFAHGTLIKDSIHELYDQAFAFIDELVEEAIPYLPQEIKYILAEYGLEAALDFTYEATRLYTPSHFFEELKGIADGSGYSYNQIIRIHMFPELTRAACSMIGSWGQAVAQTPGSLYQLRALDWMTEGPFQSYPAVLVYHPLEGNGNPFSIWSFGGFIGALTGMSSAPLGVCEKVWINYNGTQNRIGEPWHFLLRDILQYDNSVDSAISRISNAERTCSIFVGLGDPVNKFRAVEYSYEYIQVYDDINYPVYENHPRFNDVVYIDKHTQPSVHPCLASLIKEYYGQLDALTLALKVAAQLQTGDTHAAVYDFEHNYMYVAIASPYVNGTFVPAYNRPWTRLDMTSLFNLQEPSTN